MLFERFNVSVIIKFDKKNSNFPRRYRTHKFNAVENAKNYKFDKLIAKNIKISEKKS